MKLLTIAIPCYNSAKYMEKAIRSCLPAEEKVVEILIIDDGSTDETANIADMYEALYPGTIHVIHQANGGHGDAVNTGIKNATGKYFKVLDSDDWLSEESLRKMLATLARLQREGKSADMLMANYVYEKTTLGKQKSINYANAFPEETLFTWEDIHHMRYSQNILMHSVIYRTGLLRECGMMLPKHTFYVDNLYVYVPLPYVKTMYYVNTDLYHYYIGREDQSVNEKMMIKRIDQQLLVTRLIIDNCRVDADISVRLRDYMVQYLTMMMTVSTVFLIKARTDECRIKREELWMYLQETNPGAYRMVNRGFLGHCMQFSSRPGRQIILTGYSASKKIYGFN